MARQAANTLASTVAAVCVCVRVCFDYVLSCKAACHGIVR
jgi:hypothetical protein